MLALIILVSVIGAGGVIYFGMRYSVAIAEKRKKEEEERKKREKEEREKLERKKTEIKMHQEEALVIARSSPETVARIVKNWLT